MSFTTIHLEQTGGDNLERINKIMAGIPGGAFKVTYSALKRAADTAKTKAGQFAAAEYTIGKGDFMRNVTEKVNASGGAGGVASIKIAYGGHVLSLLDFDTRVSRNGTVTTKVMRNGGASTLRHAFTAKMFGSAGVFERVGNERFPVEQKFGPSTGHMMRNEKVVEQMDKTIQETFYRRIDHEILRVLNGWGR